MPKLAEIAHAPRVPAQPRDGASGALGGGIGRARRPWRRRATRCAHRRGWGRTRAGSAWRSFTQLRRLTASRRSLRGHEKLAVGTISSSAGWRYVWVRAEAARRRERRARAPESAAGGLDSIAMIRARAALSASASGWLVGGLRVSIGCARVLACGWMQLTVVRALTHSSAAVDAVATAVATGEREAPPARPRHMAAGQRRGGGGGARPRRRGADGGAD